MQLGFYLDQTKCTGCYTCSVACKDWNNVPAGLTNWRKITTIEKGDWPDLFVAHMSQSCNHCTSPICTVVCPAKAITKRNKDGIVTVNMGRCRQSASCGIIKATNIPFGEMQSPCTLTCPAGVNVQGYVALIAREKFKEAMELIRHELPLPSVCGRVCQHPCEKVCKRQMVDDPIAIMDLKRFVTEQKYPLPPALPITHEQKVAIIGSGPAGLATAWELIKAGYPVTVFEALPFAGGMLSVGIPEYRLPKAVLQRDIEYLQALGINIITNSPIGLDPSIKGLKKRGYSAIFVAIGAHRGSKIRIPGADLDGSIIGVSFLRDVNLDKKPQIGNKVVVIGGGHVAFDCARTASRLGVSEVHICCLEDSESMPADISEINEAKEEGVIIHSSSCAIEISGQDGHVSAITLSQICGLTFNTQRRPQYDLIQGSKLTLEADTVIFAIGQFPEIELFPELKITDTGSISASPVTFATSEPGVFAGGESTSGPSSVIDAIRSGKNAAIAIQYYLEGMVMPAIKTANIKPPEIEVEIPAKIKQKVRQPVTKLAIQQRKTFKEVRQGYTGKQAIAEAKRCLNCAGHLCKIVCPYNAPQFGNESNPKMQMCNLCIERWEQNKKPICVDACPTRALDAGPIDYLKTVYGDVKETEGFTHSTITGPNIIFKAKKYKLVKK